jgi:2-succinyl-5-enolpyruvyl-6-hydroxy-3-cyclohexene-1-carboxylate synthase
VSANEHLAWSRLVVGSLVAAGVRHAVVSPGSRSTPLALAALALSEAGALALDVVVDERTAAFLSLGRARATGEPSLLVCTSGTAAAHYLPALIEAEQAGVPLVVLTADRPFEAAHAGSAQTIEQTRLFGVYARRFVELGAPDGGALAGMPRLVSAAVHEALRAPAGPVHLNARFRKPLEPQGDGASPLDAEVARLLERGPPRRARATRLPSDAELDRLAAQLSQAERPLLVAGPQPAWAGHAQAAHTLARTLGAPGARRGDEPAALRRPERERSSSDTSRRSCAPGASRASSRPTWCSSSGARRPRPPTPSSSRGLEAPRVVLTDDGRADPEGNAALVLEADLAATLEALAQQARRPAPGLSLRRALGRPRSRRAHALRRARGRRWARRGQHGARRGARARARGRQARARQQPAGARARRVVLALARGGRDRVAAGRERHRRARRAGRGRGLARSTHRPLGRRRLVPARRGEPRAVGRHARPPASWPSW